MMDFDEIVVKESPGLCRCCLSEGCYKDLGSEYSWMSETEIYADMLLECFDISISQHPTGPNGSNRLICEVCITRLRDACNFKKQVLESEKKFVDMLGRGEFRPKVLLYQPQQLKTEVVMDLEEETGADEAEVEYLEDDADYVDDDLLKNESYGEPSVSEDITVSALPVKGKRGRPKKTSTATRPEKKAKVPKLEEKPAKSKAVAKGEKRPERPASEEDDKSQMSATKHNRLLKANAIAVIECSTALPFKWQRQNYLCFFCHKVFKSFAPLREHTISEHKKPNVKAAVSYQRRDENVKIDVSVILCRLCNVKLDDLNTLIAHLSSAHNKSFVEKSGSYGILPYKLQNNASFRCAVCDQAFHYFIKLNEHMNNHFGQYICELCGKGFLSRTRLRSHVLTHGARFHCSYCTEAFTSLSLKYNHECKIHNKEKVYRCFYCEETFHNYVMRKRHHHAVHNLEVPIFKCPICHKAFEYESKMKVHFKEVHVREKNFACDVCDQGFFSRTHLQKHMVKHFGERVHECQVCHKSYPRKQTLREHMRIHNNDRRFVCALCKQAFVQSNSLRMHMRVYHPEITK